MRALTGEETDGLDETAGGVPAPHTASESAAEFSLPRVVPRRVHPLSVVALLLSVVAPFVAIPLAHAVVRRLRHHGGRGHRIAQAAVVIGYLTLLMLALVAVNIGVALLLTRS